MLRLLPGESVQEYAESEPTMNTTLNRLRICWTLLLLVVLGALPAAAQSFPISTNFFGSVTWTNATGNRLQLVRVVLSLTAAQANTGRIYTLSTTTTNLVSEKADSSFRAMLWPSATSTVYVYHGDRIRATVSTTNRAFLTIDALPVDANVITNIVETDPVWTAFRTGATAVAIGTGTDAGSGGAAVGWQANGFNSGAAFGVLADGAGGQGAAFGRSANGNNSGAAVGYSAEGKSSGAALGWSAAGNYGGVAIGYSAKGSNYGAAIGYLAQAGGIGNVAMGGSDVTTNRAYVPPTMTDTVEIGRGTAVSNGWLHFRGHPIVSPDGVVVGAGGGSGTDTNALLTVTSGNTNWLTAYSSARTGTVNLTTRSTQALVLAEGAVQRSGDTMTGRLDAPIVFVAGNIGIGENPVGIGWSIFDANDRNLIQVDDPMTGRYHIANNAITVSNSFEMVTASNLTVGGAVRADSFVGNGSSLTNLNAAALASGTIPDGRIATNSTRTMGGLVTTGSVEAARFYIGTGTNVYFYRSGTNTYLSQYGVDGLFGQ